MRKRLPRHGWIGLALVLVGVAIYGGWSWWMATRTWVPLDMPVSLARGHVRSPEFKINVDTGFWIYIEVETKPDPDGVSCLTGYHSDYCRKNNVSELRASWTLSDAGRVIDQGSTEKYTGVRGGTESKARGLGEFVVPTGDRYVLDVDFPDDNSRFDSGHPELIAQNYYWGYENQQTSIFFLATFIFAIGAGLLVSAIAEPYLKRRREVISLRASETQPGTVVPLVSETAGPVESHCPRSPWIGVALAITGITTFCATAWWCHTRIFTPVDMPVSLAAGHIHTGPFPINLEDDYSISIDLDPNQPLNPMCSSYMALQTRGVLSRGGQRIDGWDSPVKGTYLESVHVTKGTYDLDAEVLPGAECLNQAHPRLRIFTWSVDYAYEAALFEWPALLFVVVGASLIVFARIAPRTDQSLSLNLSPSVGQNFRWAQRMPLRRPISGLPSFAVTAAIIFAFMAMVMMLILIPIIPKGLPVHLLKPGQSPAKSDQWNEPLIVTLKDRGPGKDPDLYVNSRPVSWDDLDLVLKEQLGQRKDWVVYVGGDDAVAYANVANVVDAAHKYGAKVYLWTNK